MPTAGAVAAALHEVDGGGAPELPMWSRAARRSPAAGVTEAVTRRAGLRPPPPLLDARPGDAGAAGTPTRLRRDPRAGVVAARQRARPRDDPRGRPCSARSRRSRRHHRDRRPPRVAQRDRGSLAVVADACAEVGVRVVCRLRGHRPPRGGGRRVRPRGERAVPAPRAGGAWSASTPPSPAPTTPWRPRPSWLPPRGRGAHPRRRGPRGRRRRSPPRRAHHRRLAAGPRRPPADDHPLAGTISTTRGPT